MKKPYISSLLRSASDVARATAFPLDKADSRRRFALIYIIRVFFLVGRRLWQDNCPKNAAALAYQTVLALVPMLAVAVAVTTQLELVEYREHIAKFAEGHLMPDAAQAVGRFVVEAASGIRLTALGLAGGGSLLVISVMLLLSVERALNDIFRCALKRPYWKRIAVSLILLVLIPVVFGLSLYYTGRLVILPGLLGTLKPLAFSVATLFLCSWSIPCAKIRMRHAVVSAVVAGVALEALKTGFAFYAKYLGATLSYLYGAFAIIPLSMIWVYLMWMVFLFGAELNASLHEVRHYALYDRRRKT